MTCSLSPASWCIHTTSCHFSLIWNLWLARQSRYVRCWFFVSDSTWCCRHFDEMLQEFFAVVFVVVAIFTHLFTHDLYHIFTDKRKHPWCWQCQRHLFYHYSWAIKRQLITKFIHWCETRWIPKIIFNLVESVNFLHFYCEWWGKKPLDGNVRDTHMYEKIKSELLTFVWFSFINFVAADTKLLLMYWKKKIV